MRFMAPANDAEAGPVVTDLIVDLVAHLELTQRVAWARELGLDPERVDLLALPPVPRATSQRAA